MKILIKLVGISYIDSSGLGELVSGYRAVEGQGGEMKLPNLNKKVSDLLQIAKRYTVVDIPSDEADAIASLKA